MNLLLDTCAFIWAATQPSRLPTAVSKALTCGDSLVFVSAISAAEIACASDRGRIRLNQHWKPWFREVLSHYAWTCLPINLEVIEESYSLPGDFHLDPADRMIVATARLQRLAVVTADQKILSYPHVFTKWNS